MSTPTPCRAGRSPILANLILVGTIISLAYFAIPTPVGASPPNSQVEALISGPSVLGASDFEPGGCAWDASGVVRPLEVGLDYESTIAVDPQEPRRMVTVWLADDGLNVNSATTIDGGRNWNVEAIPKATTCSGGIHRTSYDARVAIGTNALGSSLAYAVFTSQNQPFPDPRAGVATINVSTNAFDGTGWTDPVVVDATGSVDFPVLAIDPSKPGVAYAMWSKRIDATMFAATRDGGRSWTSPSLVRASTPGSVALNELATTPEGTIVNAYVETSLAFIADPSVPSRMYESHSADLGNTWSQPELVASDVAGGFSLAADGRATHFTWARPGATGTEVVIRTKNPHGWTEATRVSEGLPAELPGISVMADGTIGVLYYEAPAVSRDGSRPGSVVLSFSTDAGQTWLHSRPSLGFDRDKIPFIGDHSAIAASPCAFVTAWTLGSDRATYGRSDIFFSSFGTSPSDRGRCDPSAQGLPLGRGLR